MGQTVQQRQDKLWNKIKKVSPEKFTNKGEEKMNWIEIANMPLDEYLSSKEAHSMVDNDLDPELLVDRWFFANEQIGRKFQFDKTFTCEEASEHYADNYNGFVLNRGGIYDVYVPADQTFAITK